MYEIFTDVSADISPDFLEKNNIHLIHMNYIVGDKEFECNGCETDDELRNYYKNLKNKTTTGTSQIAPQTYIDYFENYVKEGAGIIYISLTAGLSKTIESAGMAVKMLKEEYENVNIEIVDSLGASKGIALLLENLCKYKDEGLGLKETADILRKNASKIMYRFVVDDLMYLKRGGRIPAAAAIIGTTLNVKPVLKVNDEGALEMISKKRGWRMVIKYLVENFAANFDESMGNHVYIVNTDNMEGASELKQELLKIKPELIVDISMLSPIIGAHTGPGLVGLIHFAKIR